MSYWHDKKQVVKHLKEDSKKWKRLSAEADREYKSDLKLMKRLK
jgi:hypothetical protein